jgi:hypothetical protein
MDAPLEQNHRDAANCIAEIGANGRPATKIDMHIP